VERNGARLGGANRDEVVATHTTEASERLRACRDDAIVDEPEVAMAMLSEEPINLPSVSETPEEVGGPREQGRR
jgi:hypothetical protein